MPTSIVTCKSQQQLPIPDWKTAPDGMTTVEKQTDRKSFQWLPYVEDRRGLWISAKSIAELRDGRIINDTGDN